MTEEIDESLVNFLMLIKGWDRKQTLDAIAYTKKTGEKIVV